MQVGMIGLGRMGANMVRRWLRGGHDCVVHDVSRDAVRALAGEGAVGCASLGELVTRLTKPRMMSHARSFVHRLRWAESGFGVLLAVLVVDVFVVAPIAQEEMLVALQPAVHAIVLASGVAIAARSRPTTLTAVGVLAVVGLGIHIVYHLHPSPPLRRLDTAMSLLFCTILGGVILAQILRPGRISLHRIGGAVTLYLLIAYSWALAYQLVALHDVAAFHWPAAALEEQRLRFQLLYFSLSTLTGVSYGDITPLNAGARSLAALEGVMGQLFPVVLLARLVSMELRDRR